MNTNSNLEFRKIKSLKFLYEINENGTILRNIKSKKQIKIHLDKHHSKNGYYKATICIGGVHKHVSIHTLVAECWLGERPEGLEIDHIDRNPHNNHYSNLRYVNHSEQMKNRVLSDRIIEQAKQNVLNHSLTKLAKPVIIEKDGNYIEFHSQMKCVEYLANFYNVKPEKIRWKLRNKRSCIYDFNITYKDSECRD